MDWVFLKKEVADEFIRIYHMNQELEKLIEVASRGKSISERQTELLRKKAVDYGEDPDLVMFLLETKHKDYLKSSVQEPQYLTTSEYVNKNTGDIINPSGKSKSRAVACLLAFFLGWLGAHKFYMGNKQAGILYLLFAWTAIPMIIAFVEVFIILLESDQKFYSQIKQ